MLIKGYQKGGKERHMSIFILLMAAALLAACLLWSGRAVHARAASAPAAPEGFLANGVRDRMVLSWEPVKGADGYEICEKRQGQKGWTVVKTTRKKRVVLYGRKTGVRYN